MPVVCWGPLAKSSNDPTTIPEYIASKILDHDVDPSAHNLDDYALFNHRGDEALDHPDGSVTMQKLNVNKFVIWTQFESLDAWFKLGKIELQGIAGAAIRIPSNAYVNYTLAMKVSDGNENVAQMKHNPWFETRCKVSSKSYCDAYIVLGDPTVPNGWGFRIIENDIYAWWVGSLDEQCQVKLGAYDVNKYRSLKAVFNYPSRIGFYIDSYFQYLATNNVQNGSIGSLIQYRFSNNRKISRQLYAQWIMYQQDNFD